MSFIVALFFIVCVVLDIVACIKEKRTAMLLLAEGFMAYVIGFALFWFFIINPSNSIIAGQELLSKIIIIITAVIATLIVITAIMGIEVVIAICVTHMATVITQIKQKLHAS